MFESLIKPCEVGTQVHCGDGKEHHVYFHIKDAVADGEEQYVTQHSYNGTNALNTLFTQNYVDRHIGPKCKLPMSPVQGP